MVLVVLFDLVGTLIEEDSNVLNKGHYENQVKAIHSSLEKDGVSVDWTVFKNYYEQVRIKQRAISELTLREYVCIG